MIESRVMNMIESHVMACLTILRHPNKDGGALESGPVSLHSLQSLNHHYRVFRMDG